MQEGGASGLWSEAEAGAPHHQQVELLVQAAAHPHLLPIFQELAQSPLFLATHQPAGGFCFRGDGRRGYWGCLEGNDFDWEIK